ncbi:uncharacterized protein LOC107640853 [Arachis ipaensis]|nr:uncharacterized protein LOC107640853 [Arachis ipaensis]
MERNQVAAVNIQPPAQEGVDAEEGGECEQANYVGNSSRQSYDPHSKTYNPVRENTSIDTSYKSYVRDVEVDFSPKAIMKVLGLRTAHFDEASYHERVGGNPDCEEIASDICVVRADWVRESNGMPIFLKRGDLTQKPRGGEEKQRNGEKEAEKATLVAKVGSPMLPPMFQGLEEQCWWPKMARKGKEKSNPLARPPPVPPKFDPVEVNEHQVREFYKNLQKKDAPIIFLRGVTLDTSDAALEALLDIPHIPPYGRPLLGCTIKPKLGLSAKNYGRAVYECLRGGLDFTKDDENVNSQPFMRWRDRFLFFAEAIFKSQAETGEIKGHYLNATAGTCEEMIKRAVFARELGAPIVMHDYLTGGFTANTSLAHYCRDNGLLLHIHRAMHAVIDRQKNHGMHFRVLAKALRLSGGDHIHAGTVVGKLEGERDITLGFVDLLRDDFIEKDRSRGIYFTQDWVSLPGVLPVASGGIHVWHMPALTEIFGDDSVLQFGGGTLGHPWGNAPGAVANRVALEACVQARNEGRDLAREGNEIIREASKWSPELAAACEVWKAIKFEFPAMDTL